RLKQRLLNHPPLAQLLCRDYKVLQWLRRLRQRLIPRRENPLLRIAAPECVLSVEMQAVVP
ncbi:MAG: hypothetical protein QXI60_07430, partial [Thermofilaceae archaeon]